MIVLALDLSKRSTGWCCTDGRAHHHGTLRCPYEPPAELSQNDIDARYAGSVSDWFRRQLFQIIENYGPTHAAIEKPLPSNLVEKKRYVRQDQGAFGQSLISVPMPATSFSTLFFLYGLAFEASGLLHRKSIPCQFVAAQTWRRSVGIGAPPKGEKDRSRWLKKQALQQCEMRGVHVNQSDAAEAVLLAIHTLGTLNMAVRVGALL